VALWNGKDPILKERLFGLTNSEGNHGEDVIEYYFYLDSTSTHSYMKYLYKYPQAEFPYVDLIETNKRRTRNDREYDPLETGVFDENPYFDVFVEYAAGGGAGSPFHPEALADIYLGRVHRWNAPEIRRSNKGWTCPDVEITVIHRSDAAGPRGCGAISSPRFSRD
jgi:hypothetical protein